MIQTLRDISVGTWLRILALSLGIPTSYLAYEWATAKFILQDQLCEADRKRDFAKLARSPESFDEGMKQVQRKYSQCLSNVSITKGTIGFTREQIERAKSK